MSRIPRRGSQVVVSYAEALAVSTSAAEGAQAGVAGGGRLRQRVRIDAIDLGFNRVICTTPAGEH